MPARPSVTETKAPTPEQTPPFEPPGENNLPESKKSAEPVETNLPDPAENLPHEQGINPDDAVAHFYNFLPESNKIVFGQYCRNKGLTPEEAVATIVRMATEHPHVLNEASRHDLSTREAMRLIRPTTNANVPPGMKACEQCGDAFTPDPLGGIYCSMTCGAAARGWANS